MMKNFTLVLIVLLGGINFMQAQSVEYGVKAGLNIANFDGGDADRNSLMAYHIGGVAEIHLSEKFSVQPELLYSRQGSEAENVAKVKVDYLSIPVLAKYYFVDQLSLEVGPQIGFLIEDKVSFNDDSIADQEADAASFDFGLNAGLAYDFAFGAFAQFRYNYGVTTVVENPDIKNSVFQFSLGYKF